MKNLFSNLILCSVLTLALFAQTSFLSAEDNVIPVVTPGTPSFEKKVGTAPSDAIVLFDGTNKEAFVSARKNKEGEPVDWELKDGILTCVPGAGDILTKEKFADCQLHIEWKVPPSNRKGQDRGNSGIKFAGLYEVQILDSLNNNTYKDGIAGAIYQQYPPMVMPTYPAGQWNTYDIIYTAPRFDEEGKLTSTLTAGEKVYYNGSAVTFFRPTPDNPEEIRYSYQIPVEEALNAIIYIFETRGRKFLKKDLLSEFSKELEYQRKGSQVVSLFNKAFEEGKKNGIIRKNSSGRFFTSFGQNTEIKETE